MIINAVHPEEFRVALVEGQTLEGFFIETASRGKVVGNIYKGIITHVQTSLQAAFVNFGMERNGFLPFTEIHPEYYRQDLPEPVRIQDVIETGQEVLVQVVKEEIGSKGALLTTYISLAGRDVVLMPGQSQRGVSRKIDEAEQREQLKELVRSLSVPEEMGIIIRTAALNRTKREIGKDLNNLLRIWEEVKKKVQESPAPAMIYKEQDLAIRVIRDYFNPDIKSILVDDREVHRQVKDFLNIISPSHERAVKLHKDDGPICGKYNLEEQIEQIFRKKVPLKSGGHLLIDQTEALVAIDVNSGRTNGEGDLEEMVFKVNMEAAAEIPRQLRLRDLGGLVVIDFIDMRENRHMRDVERRLKEEFKKDKAKITLGKISRFGLLELSRQHLGLNILRGSFRQCPICQGAGIVRSDEAAALSYLRRIWATLANRKIAIVKATVAPEVANYLLNQKRGDIVGLEERFKVPVVIEAAPGVPANAGHIEFVPREG
ncbi:MAG: Rne/Rng family ribonuclease [Syntrophobacteraceae bacterium]|jgi:ribonuclease E|nr:Rne/Rng family ribonuclease [Syntrophobacteraceae bacterium]